LGDYQSFFSAKIEADNGRRFAVDLNSVVLGSHGPIAQIWAEGEGTKLFIFDCKGHMTDPFSRFSWPMQWIPPRSIGAALAKIVCDEVASRPEHLRNKPGTHPWPMR
jgi:hypothetical protein